MSTVTDKRGEKLLEKIQRLEVEIARLQDAKRGKSVVVVVVDDENARRVHFHDFSTLRRSSPPVVLTLAVTPPPNRAYVAGISLGSIWMPISR
jgi:hypothetical protein